MASNHIISIPSRSYHILYWQHTHNAPTMYHDIRILAFVLIRNVLYLHVHNSRRNNSLRDLKLGICLIGLLEPSYWRELMINGNVFSPRNNPARKWQNSKWKLCNNTNVQLLEKNAQCWSVLQGHRSHESGVSSKHRELDCLFHSYIKVTTKTLKKHKNIGRHTAHTVVSWPNPKQWVIVHTSDLMMIIRQNIYILSTITKEMGKLKTHSPTYCLMDNWENVLNLTHTLDKLYLTGIL